MPLDPLLMKMHRKEVKAPEPTPIPDTSMADVGVPEEIVRVPEVPEGDKLPAVIPVEAPTVEGILSIAPSSFKTKLDELDGLIQSELGLSAFNIDMVRGYVKDIMMDLQIQPELDAVLIDRDVHNVLRFIRHVKDAAVASRVEAKVKKEVKKAKAGRLEGFSLDKLDLSLPAPKINALGLSPLNLEGLGKLKT